MTDSVKGNWTKLFATDKNKAR